MLALERERERERYGSEVGGGGYHREMSRAYFIWRELVYMVHRDNMRVSCQ